MASHLLPLWVAAFPLTVRRMGSSKLLGSKFPQSHSFSWQPHGSFTMSVCLSGNIHEYEKENPPAKIHCILNLGCDCCPLSAFMNRIFGLHVTGSCPLCTHAAFQTRQDKFDGLMGILSLKIQSSHTFINLTLIQSAFHSASPSYNYLFTAPLAKGWPT